MLIHILISNLSAGTELRKPCSENMAEKKLLLPFDDAHLTAGAGVSPSPNQTDTYADTMRDNCTEPKQLPQKGNT
jgi:hypothetical protein